MSTFKALSRQCVKNWWIESNITKVNYFESIKDEVRQVSCLVCRDKETPKKPVTQYQRSGIPGFMNSENILNTSPRGMESE